LPADVPSPPSAVPPPRLGRAANLFLLAGGMALVTAVAALAWSHRPVPAQAWRAASLGIPPATAPWVLTGDFDGFFLEFSVPATPVERLDLPAGTLRKLRTKVELRDRNVRVLADLALGAERLLATTRLVAPERYRRALDEVVISVHEGDARGGDPLFRHRPVLEQLPPYTRLEVFAPTDLVAAARERLAALGLADRAALHAVARWESDEGGLEIVHDSTTWAQDLFLFATDPGGREYVVAPASHAQIEDLERTDNDWLDALADGSRRAVVRLPIFFRAGNVLNGEVGGRRLAFIGQDELDYNAHDTFNAAYFDPPDAAVVELLKAVTGAGELVVVPNAGGLFHIDMAMEFIGPGAAAVIRPLDPQNLAEQERDVLAFLRVTLQRLGFRIVDVPTTAARVHAFRSPANVVLWTDRRDGRLHAFVPRFPDATVVVGARRRSLNDLVKEAYEGAGVSVAWAEDRLSSKHGDLRCAFNVVR
jgi:hypothetical protein